MLPPRQKYTPQFKQRFSTYVPSGPSEGCTCLLMSAARNISTPTPNLDTETNTTSDSPVPHRWRWTCLRSYSRSTRTGALRLRRRYCTLTSAQRAAAPLTLSRASVTLPAPRLVDGVPALRTAATTC